MKFKTTIVSIGILSMTIVLFLLPGCNSEPDKLPPPMLKSASTVISALPSNMSVLTDIQGTMPDGVRNENVIYAYSDDGTQTYEIDLYSCNDEAAAKIVFAGNVNAAEKRKDMPGNYEKDESSIPAWQRYSVTVEGQYRQYVQIGELYVYAHGDSSQKKSIEEGLTELGY